MYKPKKRLFIALILLSLVFIIFCAYAAWKISFSGLYDINEILPFFIAGGLILIFLIVSLGLLGMILAIIGCPTFSFLKDKHGQQLIYYFLWQLCWENYLILIKRKLSLPLLK